MKDDRATIDVTAGGKTDQIGFYVTKTIQELFYPIEKGEKINYHFCFVRFGSRRQQ